MTKYAIIPDLHADHQRLKDSLKAADNTPIAFLGDFIDAGNVESEDDEAVLNEVRSLVDSNCAVAVMGNHELNAILFHMGDDLKPLRPHSVDQKPLRSQSDDHRKQHRSFIDKFGIGTPEALKWTDWFLTLPLWLELDGFRLVHACWDDDAIATVAERRPDGRLQVEDLLEVSEKKTKFAQAVERLTSGPEVELPNVIKFHDNNKKLRGHVRLAWWKAQNGTWREVALAVPDLSELPDTPVSGAEAVPLYPNDAPPVFVGHYKMQGSPRIEAHNAICLDYPTDPCVYLWKGEARLTEDNLKPL